MGPFKAQDLSTGSVQTVIFRVSLDTRLENYTVDVSATKDSGDRNVTKFVLGDL